MSNSFAPPLAQDPSQAIYQNGYQELQSGSYAQPGMWMDPGSGVMTNAGLGMGLVTPQPHMGYAQPDGNGFVTQNVMQPGMGGQWGDGNSAQYWNTLIDSGYLTWVRLTG